MFRIINGAHHQRGTGKAPGHTAPEKYLQVLSYFEYVLSTVLLLTGHPQEAQYYMEYSEQIILIAIPYRKGLHQTMNLLRP
jgi:hypothetical protein